MLLKCADIGHLAAAPANHRRWALCLEEEFFQQVTAHLACNIQFDIQFDINLQKHQSMLPKACVIMLV